MKYPIESLLRPPVEYYSALSLTCLSLVCLLAPSLLMLTPSVSYAIGFALLARAILRFLQARSVVSYQRGLLKLPFYKIRPQDIPNNEHYLFLGRGFRWTPLHTQRLLDALDRKGQAYATPSVFYRKARELEIALANKKRMLFLVVFLRSNSIFNPVKPLPEVGGSTLLHGVEPNETTITLAMSERSGHVGVYGTTRQGKSRLCEILIAQDIARGDSATVCFDPKGDAGLLKRCVTEAIRNNREFYVFHLGFPDLSARYNTIGSFSRISEVATRSTSQISGEGSSAAFKEFCWRFANIISQARVLLGIRPSYQQLKRDIMDIEPLFIEYMEYFLDNNSKISWRKDVKVIIDNPKFKPPRYMAEKSRYSAAIEVYITKHKIFDPIGAGLLSSLRYDKTYFDKIVASLIPQLERLTSGRLTELLSPDYNDPTDNRPIIDWMHIIRKKAVVYFGLDAMTDIDTSSTVASSAFADLLSTSGYLYKFGYENGLQDGRKGQLPIVNIHGDEFNEYCGCFGPLLNKAGGSGVRCVLYTQTRSDLEVGTQSPARAGVLEGNMNTIIMMRVKGRDTAELLTDQLPKTSIDQLTRVTAANDSAEIDNKVHFTSKNEDRITSVETDTLTTDQIMQLPKGQAFMLTKGSELSKIRFPLIDDSADNIELPDHVEDMCAGMLEKYQTGDEWWKFLPSHDVTLPDIDFNELAKPFNDVYALFEEQEDAILLEA